MNGRKAPHNLREAAVTMLRPFYPELTPDSLHRAITSFDKGGAAEVAKPQPGKLLTAREVADRLGIGVRSVYRLAAEGKLSRVKLAPKTTRFPERGLEELGALPH